MKKYALIVAGGSGKRMGTDIPKQFLQLHGKPVLWHTLSTFLAAFDDLEIILVVADDRMQTGKDIIEATDHPERIRLTGGGSTRFHSVKNGLQHIHQHSIVFVHDGVRCLLSTDLIHRCYASALKHGNAIPAIQSVDSLRIETTHGNKFLDREQVKIIQTPQTFQSEVIKAGYEQEFQEFFTDEASVVEQLGVKINLIEGELTNIKITNPFDMLIAENIRKQFFI